MSKEEPEPEFLQPDERDTGPTLNARQQIDVGEAPAYHVQRDAAPQTPQAGTKTMKVLTGKVENLQENTFQLQGGEKIRVVGGPLPQNGDIVEMEVSFDAAEKIGTTKTIKVLSQ